MFMGFPAKGQLIQRKESQQWLYQLPFRLKHAPSPRKPSRRADAQQWQSWRALSAAATITRRGAERLTHLRQAIDEFAGGGTRPLLVCADATFINRTVLRDLPPRTTFIGHIRKDARLYALPTAEEESHGEVLGSE
jgi:hypothetical protein